MSILKLGIMKLLYCTIFSILICCGLVQQSFADPLRIPLKRKQSTATTQPIQPSLGPHRHRFPRSRRASTKNDSAEIHLKSILVDIEASTPPQYFYVDFDTGSSDVWVPHPECINCSNRTKFDPSKSLTVDMSDSNDTWTIGYGDGSRVFGTNANDTINIGGLNVSNQPIGLVTTQSVAFERNVDMDGIFGLSFPGHSHTGQRTPIPQAMKKQGLIKEAIVSFWFGHVHDGGDGEVLFGEVNHDHYDGELQYVPITDHEYWEIDMDGISIDGQQIMNSSLPAVVDTGTTQMILPAKLAKEIHGAINGSEYTLSDGWLIPCNIKDDTKVTFTFGAKDFPVPISALVREKPSSNSTMCYSTISSIDSDKVVIGNSFLRIFYSVFDYDNGRIGLAPSKP